MEVNKNNIALRNPSLFTKAIIILWMTGILLLHLILFPPPVLMAVADYFNINPRIAKVHNGIKKYFLTTDYSKHSVISTSFWRSISGDQ
jgi:hypothetical protein